MEKSEIKTVPFFAKKRAKGEPWVWFTGMGLGVGVLMISALLTVIFIKGFEVFWPNPVLEITLSQSQENPQVVAGVVAKEQVKKIKELDARGTQAREWQMFLGNKEVYGFSFKYINHANIIQITRPSGLVRIERQEYGDAFGYPVQLELSSGEIISFENKDFLSKLSEIVDTANLRWKEIQRIEKKEIGAINYKLTKLKLKEKAALRETVTGQNDELRQIREKMARLEEEYKILAAEAGALRQKQNETFLTYRLAGGEEKRLAAGKIVDFYFPNQLNPMQRLFLFFKKMFLFLTEEPREANTEGGVFPAIFGTFVMTVLMSIAVTPFGVIAAIYLREYAKQGFFVRAVRVAVNNLAGVPSIVFGVFGLGFFVYLIGGTIDHLFYRDALPTPTFGTGGIIWAALTLALLTVPVVIVATEEAIAAVPRGAREGSLACGASKWQTILHIVLPASAPGILTGLILAMARGASEVAPLMLVGVVKLAPNLPLDNLFPFIHLERKFMHLGFHIYDLGFQSPDSDAAKPMVFATTLLLMTLVVLLNFGAIFIRERLRRKFATGAF